MTYSFGDQIVNIAASNDNPSKYGYFVKYVYRGGRVNPGKFVQYYANGGFHETDPDNTEPNLSERSLSELQAENQRLKQALQEIKSAAEFPQQAYDRNGPSFASPAGLEYEFTSDFLAKCNDLSEIARKALEATNEK